MASRNNNSKEGPGRTSSQGRKEASGESSQPCLLTMEKVVVRTVQASAAVVVVHVQLQVSEQPRLPKKQVCLLKKLLNKKDKLAELSQLLQNFYKYLFF